MDAASAQIGAPVPPPGVPGPFSLGDAGRLRGLLADAGLADVQVGELPVPLRAASFEEWWTRTSALAGPLPAILAVAARRRRAGHARARPRGDAAYETAAGGLDFPGVTLIATGRRAGAPSGRRAARRPRPRGRWPGGTRCASPGGAR